MKRTPSRDPDGLQDYFATLPAYIQESVKQSGLDFTCEEDLRCFVESLKDCRGEQN